MAANKQSILLVLEKPITAHEFSLKIKPMHKTEFSEMPYRDKLPFRLNNHQEAHIEELFAALLENYKETPVICFKVELLLTEGEVTLLRMDLLNLFEIPETVKDFQNLEALSVRHNYLEELPEFIYSLKALERLDVAGNEIEELSPAIGQLENLTYLNVDLNPLLELPGELDQISGLSLVEIPYPIGYQSQLVGNKKHVFLNNADLTFQFIPSTCLLLDLDPILPAIMQRVKLDELKAYLQLKNAGLITEFDTIFRYWDRAKCSWQIDNGSKTMSEEEYEASFEFDEVMFEAMPIMILSMENRNLRRIPELVMEFEELRLLNVSNNKITSLPSWLLRHPTLEGLIIKENPIRPRDVPSEFYHHFQIIIKKDQIFYKEDEEDEEDDLDDVDSIYSEEDLDFELGKESAYEDFQKETNEEDDYYIIEDEDEDEKEERKGGIM